MAVVGKTTPGEKSPFWHPFVNVVLWTLLLALGGILFGLTDPAGGVPVYGLVLGAIGFAVGLYTALSDDPVGEALRLPQGFMTLAKMGTGPTK